MSGSLRSQELQPSRLLCPWDFPGKSTGVGCHFLLQMIFLTQGLNPCLVHQQVDSLPLSHQGNRLYQDRSSLCLHMSAHCCLHAEPCLTLCDPMDCSLPGSSVHGISQARYWSGLPFPSPRDLLDPRIEPMSPTLAGRFFTTEPVTVQ